MESVPEFINSIIMKIFPTEISYAIIIMGFLIFFLCFYGTKEWKSFTDLDKIIFSIFTGALFWYLFIFPIAMSYEALKIVFAYTEDLDAVNNSIHDFDFISSIIVLSFIIARILSKPPLFYNEKFLKLPELIRFLLIFMYFPLLFILFSFYSSVYKYVPFLVYTIASSIIFLFGFYFILLKIIYIHSDFRLVMIIAIKKSKLNKKSILTVIFIIFIAFVIGQFYNPSTVNENVKITKLEIPILPTDKNSYGTLSGNLIYNDTFGLKFGLVKWAFISKNFTIKDASREGTSSKIENISGNVVILRGDSKMNVTLIGNQEIIVDKNFYSLDTENINNTEIWNISFNRMDYEIDINEIIIKPQKDLRLTNYKNYGLTINRERLDEKLNKSMSSFTIEKVEIPNAYYNDGINITKISLYFIDNNS